MCDNCRNFCNGEIMKTSKPCFDEINVQCNKTEIFKFSECHWCINREQETIRNSIISNVFTKQKIESVFPTDSKRKIEIKIVKN